MATHTITADNLQSSVDENNIVVLDFWASWCGPCKMFAPVFEGASEQHDDVFFGKIDTEDQPQLARQLNIQGIPTLMVFRDQILVFRQAGALPAPAFEDLLKQVKELDMDEVRAEIAKQEESQAADG